MARYIDADKSVDIGYLSDWYQNSIDDTKPPIWTDEHLEELTNDFIIIPKDAPTADVVEVPEIGIGNLSDGYHTFNELYHHRAILFSVICNSMPDKAWKSKLHDTGDMFENMFIVGIETPNGQATYHYDIEPYWDMFKVKELEKAPKWDGHTPADAINRIATLSADVVEVPKWIDVNERLPKESGEVLIYSEYYITKCMFSKKHRLFNALDDNSKKDAKKYCINITHWMPLPEPPSGAEMDGNK